MRSRRVQVAGEVGDGVEFARKKVERRLIKDMDKAAIGLHVADCKRIEAVAWVEPPPSRVGPSRSGK